MDLSQALADLFEKDIEFCNKKFGQAPDELKEALEELKEEQ